MRFNGPIPTLEKDKYPKRLLIFDTEAVREGFKDGLEVQTYRLGIARYLSLSDTFDILEDEYHVSRTGDELAEFIEWQTRKDKALYVYAHNLKYDLQLSGLLTILLSKGWKLSLFVLEDPPSFIRLKRDRKSIVMIDTFNYWQFSVSAMGDQLGLAKLTMPALGAEDKEWITYCKRDVEVLSEYLLSFMRFLLANDLAGLGLTLASQSFRAYRHRFMPCDIVIHSDQRALALERSGYTGGRVEAFFIGTRNTEDYFKLDVNSMYPYVMQGNTYPVELKGYTENIPLDKLDRLLDRYYCIAEVELSTSEPVYAFRGEHKLIFPVGEFRTVLHHNKLLYARKHNQIMRVLRVSCYKRGDIFSQFIDFFYQLKVSSEREHNPINRHLAKILMNSLYGKFGQREVVSKIIDNPGPAEYKRLTGYSEALGLTVEVNYLGNQIELRYKSGESAYSFPAIAGAVTSNARLYLWELINRAGLENVFYVDTDSLMTNKAGYDNLTLYLDPSRLGAIKLEDMSSSLAIFGAKDYQFGHEIKHKGVPKSALEVSPGKWQYEQFRGAKTWLTDGLPVNAEIYQRFKARKSAYDKGIVTESGLVLPLRLGRGEGYERVS